MPKMKALFLDRDGVINLDRGYVGLREQFEFTPGIFAFLREVNDKGYRLVIVTNQSGVARGLYTREEYNDLTEYMIDRFLSEEIKIDMILQCFEIKDAKISRYSRESFWRKPNPGMILEAAQKLNLNLEKSVMIGDNQRDIEAAFSAGIKNGIFFLWNKKDIQRIPNVPVARNFDEALKFIPD